MSCTHVTKRRFNLPCGGWLEGSLAQCAVRRSVQLEHAIQALVYATPDDFSNATRAVVDLLRDIGATAPADTLVTMQCTPSWMMSWPEERWALRNGGMRAVWRDQLNNNIRAHRRALIYAGRQGDRACRRAAARVSRRRRRASTCVYWCCADD